MKTYHAHIYFEEPQKSQAEQLVKKLLDLNITDLKLWKFHYQKIGPHFLPMAEIHFGSHCLNLVLSCLKLNNDGLSILVHEDSGDDFKDHENPIWFGRSLPIDFDFFQRVKDNPTLSVH